jgi:hypothetical protein
MTLAVSRVVIGELADLGARALGRAHAGEPATRVRGAALLLAAVNGWPRLLVSVDTCRSSWSD